MQKIDLEADPLPLLQNAAVLNSQDTKQSCSLSAGVFQGSAFEILFLHSCFAAVCTVTTKLYLPESKKHRATITHIAKKLIKVIYALEMQDVDFNV